MPYRVTERCKTCKNCPYAKEQDKKGPGSWCHHTHHPGQPCDPKVAR